LKLLALSTKANSSSTGITEAFKADSFEKKINLGSQSLLQPILAPPPFPRAIVNQEQQVLVPTAMTRASPTFSPPSGLLRRR